MKMLHIVRRVPQLLVLRCSNYLDEYVSVLQDQPAGMAQQIVQPAGEKAFKVLYEFHNTSLLRASCEEKVKVMKRFEHIDMYGDAELLAAVAPRDAFAKDTNKAMQDVSAAMITLHERSPIYYRDATFPKLETTNQYLPLTDAGFWNGFTRFGALEADEVDHDGMVDEYQTIFYDESDPRHAAAKADLATIQTELHGCVMSAWFDEDARSLQVQAVHKSSANNGNHREFFIFSKHRVYTFDFWTS